MDVVEILLVEDNPDDCDLLLRAANYCGLKVRVHPIESCRKAIDYLEARGRYADRPRYPLPDLVLLDLVMPGVDGLTFLAWRKNNPCAAAFPTIVFSGLQTPETQARVMAAGANGFVAKPFELAQWPAAIREACHLAGLSLEARVDNSSADRRVA